MKNKVAFIGRCDANSTKMLLYFFTKYDTINAYKNAVIKEPEIAVTAPNNSVNVFNAPKKIP